MQLRFASGPGKKLAAEQLCAEQDVTPSQVVRRLIRDDLATHGVALERVQAERPAELA